LKILYGINTLGQGHINESRTIIKQLRKDGHHIDCVFSGPKPPKYAYKIGNRWISIHGYRMEFNEHGPVPAKIFINNILNFKSVLESILKTYRIILNGNYRAVISDFELSTCLAGFLLNKPVIVIDHQHSIIHPSALRAPGKLFDILNALFALAISIPYFTHVFTLDFVQNPIRRFKETLFPLIQKQEIKKLTISVKNHYCVYLPYISLKKLYYIFTHFPKYNFHIYGFDINKKIKNLYFKKTSRKGFLKNMASSKGVISHAGFSITWEIFLLQKPFYTIPLKRHYEQLTNAYRLSKKSLAFVRNILSVDFLKDFISKSKQCNFKRKRNIKILDVKLLAKLIYKEIDKK